MTMTNRDHPSHHHCVSSSALLLLLRKIYLRPDQPEGRCEATIRMELE